MMNTLTMGFDNARACAGETSHIRSISQRAALFLVFGMTLSVVKAEEDLITALGESNAATRWVSVNDGVMGGVSEGQFEITESKTLRFSGTLSLENNGGFASIRSEPRSMNLAGMTAVEVKARGDGRTYWVELRGARQMGASSYRAYLATADGDWTTTNIPLADFKLQSYGRPLQADAIDPSTIRSIGFMLADKKEGPFRLEIESVKAISGEGSGKKTLGSGNTIVDVAKSTGNFETLLAAAAAADLAGVLSGVGPFTVLAPTDEAFAKLPAGTVEELLKQENKQQLADILKYHVIAGRVTLAQALDLKESTTLLGESVSARFIEGRVKIGPSNLIQADIPASNGIIHVVDQVLIPTEVVHAPLSPAALIELAVERAVPLFNHGNPGACAAVYEVTCQSLRAMPGMDEHSLTDLERALTKVRSETSLRQRAWILRHALDRVYARLAGD